MTPPSAAVSVARALSSQWIELYLPENAYDPAAVEDPAHYWIGSGTDPAYATSVHPVDVDRRHYAESAPYTPQTDGSADVAHLQIVYRIYLATPEPLRPGDTYTVSVVDVLEDNGPFTFTYSPETPTDAMHVNQVGSATTGPKVFDRVVEHWCRHEPEIDDIDALVVDTLYQRLEERGRALPRISPHCQ